MAGEEEEMSLGRKGGRGRTGPRPPGSGLGLPSTALRALVSFLARGVSFPMNFCPLGQQYRLYLYFLCLAQCLAYRKGSV